MTKEVNIAGTQTGRLMQDCYDAQNDVLTQARAVAYKHAHSPHSVLPDCLLCRLRNAVVRYDNHEWRKQQETQ